MNFKPFPHIWIYLIPEEKNTHTHTHTRTVCLWLRVSRPVITACGVGKLCLSRPPAKGRARVKTLIGREKLYSITVYLCARTGKIKGWLWERERGGEERKGEERKVEKGSQIHRHRGRERKVIQRQGDRENSKFWKHRRNSEAGKEKIDREDK